MAGNTNFPTALDDNTSLHDVTDGVTALAATHHNNLKEAVKAIEAKLGIFNTTAPTALDYRLGHPSSGHQHNAASGQGPQISASALLGINELKRHVMLVGDNGTRSAIASQIFMPVFIPRPMVFESVDGLAVRGPSGGTSILDVHIGATSLWQASQGFRLMMGPTAGRMVATSGTPNLVTAPSGAFVTVDLDQVGANVGYDRLSITLVFRE